MWPILSISQKSVKLKRKHSDGVKTIETTIVNLFLLVNTYLVRNIPVIALQMIYSYAWR